MRPKRKLLNDALGGTTSLGQRLQRSRAMRDLPDDKRRELAFHVSEIVVDVVCFLQSSDTGVAWERLCRDLVVHWPHHDMPARRLLARR